MCKRLESCLLHCGDGDLSVLHMVLTNSVLGQKPGVHFVLMQPLIKNTRSFSKNTVLAPLMWFEMKKQCRYSVI